MPAVLSAMLSMRGRTCLTRQIPAAIEPVRRLTGVLSAFYAVNNLAIAANNRCSRRKMR